MTLQWCIYNHTKTVSFFVLGFKNEIDWVRIRLNRLVNERETSDEGMCCHKWMLTQLTFVDMALFDNWFLVYLLFLGFIDSCVIIFFVSTQMIGSPFLLYQSQKTMKMHCQANCSNECWRKLEFLLLLTNRYETATFSYIYLFKLYRKHIVFI